MFFSREVTSSPEGPKHSKKGQTDRKACQERAHTAVELKYFCVYLVFRGKIHSKPLKAHFYLHLLFALLFALFADFCAFLLARFALFICTKTTSLIMFHHT